MSETFTIEIITPNETILKTEVSEVVIPSYEGDMGILKDHISLITFLRPGLIVIKGKSESKFFVEEGTVEFSENNLLILTSKAQNLESLKKEEIHKLIGNTEKELKEDKLSDKQKYILSHKIDVLKEIR